MSKTIQNKIYTIRDMQVMVDRDLAELYGVETREEKGTSQKQHIFYNGQIFDAYLFVSDMIKSAKISIKLIDDKEVYHFGASLKDLGKKWFAVSKLEMDVLSIVEKLK